MYRFKSAMRLFTPTAATSTFGSRRRYGGSVGRKILPPEFATNVVRLTCDSTAEGGECEVYVVGTTHNSPKSGEDVKNVVNFVKPQVLFVELCSSRTEGILYPPKVHTLRFGPITWTFTRRKDQVDSEFRIAFNEANKFGAKVILGDRPIEITEMRYHDKHCRMPWRAMKILVKRQLMTYALRKNLDKAVNADDVYKRKLDLLHQLDPIYTEVFTYERDQYMSAKLLEVARKHSLIVAVMGKAHLLGIQKYWKQPVEVKQLLSVQNVCRRNRMIVVALAIFLAVLRYFFIIFYS